MPSGPDVRVDTGLAVGDRVAPEYDNLMAKIMVSGEDREAAITALRRALDQTEVAGLQTTLPFHRYVASHPGFARAELSIDWVEATWDGPTERDRVATQAAGAAVAAIDALARDGRAPAGPPDSTGAPPSRTGWREAGREEAVDRWPE
jgi:acetyl-CoA/propionyl-CoA carboxylase biotin carboxyl carrier protein